MEDLHVVTLKQACVEGTYSFAGDDSCLPCPSGQKCPDSTSPIDCPPGYVSTSGVSTCSECPAGTKLYKQKIKTNVNKFQLSSDIY